MASNSIFDSFSTYSTSLLRASGWDESKQKWLALPQENASHPVHLERRSRLFHSSQGAECFGEGGSWRAGVGR
ncbi:hypothetical protein JZ751_011373, partial [Albula glossodonta]